MADKSIHRQLLLDMQQAMEKEQTVADKTPIPGLGVEPTGHTNPFVQPGTAKDWGDPPVASPVEDIMAVRQLARDHYAIGQKVPQARKVYNRRPFMKIWPIPARGQRVVQFGPHNVEYKFCDHCHLPKWIQDFRSDATRPDGRYGTCKGCEYGRKRYKEMIRAGIIPPQPDRNWAEEFPTTVCLCGSTRFQDKFEAMEFQETLLGHIVLTVGGFAHGFIHLPENATVKANLDTLHLRKIDLADEILVINVGGYIGPSTTGEIAYAESLGKTVRYLE